MKYLLSTLLLLSVIVTGFIPAQMFVQGRIVDERGNPIQGAIVKDLNGNNSTVTDAAGKFRLEIKKPETELLIKAIGFADQKIKTKLSEQLSVVLISSNIALEEVVVTGASLHKKTVFSNTVMPGVSVSAYKQMPAQQLQGRISGVLVKQGRGAPTVGAGLRKNKLPGHIESNYNREGYDVVAENSFLAVTDQPLSTFSIDVDAASYSNVRRFINEGQIPPDGAIRIEEMINYFSYQYPQPKDGTPFSINTELATCPWNKENQLLLIGLQGRQINLQDLPASNLVFLVDVSGSMYAENKLPLVKASLKLLADQLRPTDKVSIVTYAGSAGLALPATSGEYRTKIKEAIDQLEAGGSTAGGAGIQLAYKVAREHFKEKGNNRVILCTDGDFNVGQTSDAALEVMIEKERKSGVFLTVLGYGMGNYQDAKMQKLADKGNGNHAYIDGISEAKKVLISEFGGTLYAIAKDVKLQVEFNPQKVKGYRLIGYENRVLAKEDFNNDAKDAGELGSGHTVTAIYELVPPGASLPQYIKPDSLKYQSPVRAHQSQKQTVYHKEWATIKFRYKEPESETSKLLTTLVQSDPMPISQSSSNLRFAAAVASFGLTLRSSLYKGTADFDLAIGMAKSAPGIDKDGYRREFITLVEKAKLLSLKQTQTVNEFK